MREVRTYLRDRPIPRIIVALSEGVNQHCLLDLLLELQLLQVLLLGGHIGGSVGEARLDYWRVYGDGGLW